MAYDEGLAQRVRQALAKPHVGPFDITGRPMKGWVTMKPEGCEGESDLQGWVNRGVATALSLPPK